MKTTCSSNSPVAAEVRRRTCKSIHRTPAHGGFEPPAGFDADDFAVATDGAGNIYVAACDIYPSGSGFSHIWTVRKGVGGTSFSTVDTLPNGGHWLIKSY